MADGIIGFGTKLEYQQTSVSGSYVEIVDVITIEPPPVTQKNASYQPLRTTRNKQKKAGVGELGDFKFTCLWTASLMSVFMGMLFDETVSFRITHSNGTNTEVFACLLKELPRKIVVDDVDMIEFTGDAYDALTIA